MTTTSDSRPPMIIAIDGPAASGKSSTAQRVAKILGAQHMDSGALYRAATAVQLRHGSPSDAWTEDQLVAGATSISLVASGHGFVPLIDGHNAEEEIRGPEVTRQVSRVAQMARVREWVNGQVRQAARLHSVVVDGRDIGTTVFPDATLKIFLMADPWERARRRLMQRTGQAPTDDEIAEETDRLVHRDARDATQSAPAADAVFIDTTSLTQDEQVERIVALAHAVSHRHP